MFFPLSFPFPTGLGTTANPSQNLVQRFLFRIFGRFFRLPNRAWKMISKKHRKKCENRWLGLPQTLPKSSQNAFKIAFPKNMRFCIDFWWIFVASCKSQTLKFVRPRSVSWAFHTIQVFAFCMHFRSEKPTKNPSKTKSERWKNRCQKRVVF